MISFEFDIKLRQIYYSFDTQSGSLHKQLIITNIYPFAYDFCIAVIVRDLIYNTKLIIDGIILHCSNSL